MYKMLAVVAFLALVGPSAVQADDDAKMDNAVGMEAKTGSSPAKAATLEPGEVSDTKSDTSDQMDKKGDTKD